MLYTHQKICFQYTIKSAVEAESQEIVLIFNTMHRNNSVVNNRDYKIQ